MLFGYHHQVALAVSLNFAGQPCGQLRSAAANEGSPIARYQCELDEQNATDAFTVLLQPPRVTFHFAVWQRSICAAYDLALESAFPCACHVTIGGLRRPAFRAGATGTGGPNHTSQSEG